MKWAIFLAAILLSISCQSPYSGAKELELHLPKEDTTNIAIPLNDETLNIILEGNNNIFYYYGKPDKVPRLKESNYTEIRDILMEKRKSLGTKFIVLIKPAASSTYSNTVRMLDEVTICDIKKYVMIDISTEEEKQLAQKKAILNFKKVNKVIHDSIAVSKEKSITR